MNDPWNVKSVRQGHQYQSCMKINGVPLLPPVLSKECRKEMQYYKLLAKEVEKRISILRPYVEETDSGEDRTDAPELPECEQNDELLPKNNNDTFCIVTDNFEVNVSPLSEKSNFKTSSPGKYQDQTSRNQDVDIIKDIDLVLQDSDKTIFDSSNAAHHNPVPHEVPERDCDFKSKPQKGKELLVDVETSRKQTQKELIDDLINFEFTDDNEFVPLHQDGPSSLSSKSFTGSLLDLHSESAKEAPKLIRQRSYTVLKPSPQLLAHLEVQSISTGVDVNSISMSESMSCLNLPCKKRKSWDLESAKVKWSSMALELKRTNMTPRANGGNNPKNAKKTSPMSKSHSQIQDKTKKMQSTKAHKSEPINIKPKNVHSPLRIPPSEKAKEPSSPIRNGIRCSPKSATLKKEDVSVKDSSTTLIPATDDPASRVRELYEKLQKQQVMQMANLMEKQKREQQLLQQVFEEQNTVLLKQLKTVCPKASIEVKQAWGDLKDDEESGPVSLSQLINNPSPERPPTSPVSKTLTDTNNYISKCDNVLKKSRDITNSLKKQQPKAWNANNRAPRSAEATLATKSDGNRTRTHSPNQRNTSRKLNYDNSSSDYESILTTRDYEPMLTDRTNDTMADLNVTFPSDSDDCRSFSKDRRKVNSGSPMVTKNGKCLPSTDSAIRHLEDTIHSSMNAMCLRPANRNGVLRQPTSQELTAASKIVAVAKGYLVRRLMATERVQATVQTIKDALLCALQLHQDREGIRGADVDLHRRLIQQITAACYNLHDTFVASTPAERCALIAADRARKQALASRQSTPRSVRRTEILDNETLFAITPLPLVNYSDQETFSADKMRSSYAPSPQRRPWR